MKALAVFVWDNIFPHKIADPIVSVNYFHKTVDIVVNTNQRKLAITQINNCVHDVIEGKITNISSQCFEHIINLAFDRSKTNAINHLSH